LFNYKALTSNFEITDIVISDALNLIVTGHQYAKKTESEDSEYLGMLTVWKFPLWNFKNTEFIMVFPFLNRISKLLYSECDKKLIVGTNNGKIYVESMEDVMKYSM
jgi:hypothetical protein